MISKSDLKKPLEGLTKLDQEKVKSYKRGEELENLEIFGGENERKAAKWLKEYVDKLDKEEWNRKQFDLEVLTKLQRKKPRYYRFLGVILKNFILEENIPQGFVLDLNISDKGLVLYLTGTKFYGAFKPCGVPIMDRGYCKILAMKLGNTVARIQGYYRQSLRGITLPYKDQVEKISHGRTN